MRMSDREARPQCLKCRRPLAKGGRRPRRWRCNGCGTDFAIQRSRSHTNGGGGGNLPPRPTVHPFPVEILARPSCLGCRRPMWRQGSVRRSKVYVRWLCRACNVAVGVRNVRLALPVVEGRRAVKVAGIPERDCPKCSRRMRRNGYRLDGKPRFYCAPCGNSSPLTKSQRERLATKRRRRPHCVKCRRAMRSNGGKRARFRCHLCGAMARARWSAPKVEVSRPSCVPCRRPMILSGQSPTGVQRFRCHCGASATARKTRSPETNAELLTLKVKELVPDHLPRAVREDVCQSIVLEVLKGRPLRSLKASDVKTAVREAYGFAYHPRFISLESPNRDGSPFGATLEG